MKGNAGVDAVVEAAGSPAAVEEGLELLRPGGSYLVAGFGDPAGTFELDPYRLARRQIRLQGVWTSDARHLAHAVAVVKKQPEVIKRIGTEYPLEAANEALVAMEKREIIKAVLKPVGRDQRAVICPGSARVLLPHEQFYPYPGF